MVFKLVRIDKPDAFRIKLENGKHLIGRGKVLHCDDKRVSRNHGEVEVTDNYIILRALHSNPIFYIRNGSQSREILKQNDTVELGNSDRFGLLPVDFWFEVLRAPSDAEPDKKEVESQQQNSIRENGMLDNTVVDIDVCGTDRIVDSSINFGARTINENLTNQPVPQTNDEAAPCSPMESNQSQSLIQDINLSNPTQSVSDTQTVIPNPEPSTANEPVRIKTEPKDKDSVQDSPLKRPIQDMPNGVVKTEYVVKRIKMDPDEAIAGSSSAQSVYRSRSSSNEILSRLSSHIDQTITMDRWDHSAKSWAGVLRHLPKNQQIFAEKLINDVLFEAQLNTLCRDSRVDARLPAIDLTHL